MEVWKCGGIENARMLWRYGGALEALKVLWSWRELLCMCRRCYRSAECAQEV